MTKRLLVCILVLGLTGHVTGCSSSGSKDEADVAEANEESFSEESEADFAESGGDDELNSEAGEEAGGEAGGETAVAESGAEGTGEAAPSGEAGGDASAGGGEANAETTAEGGAAPEDELTLDEGEEVAQSSGAGAGAGGDALPDEVMSETPTDSKAATESPPPADDSLFADNGETLDDKGSAPPSATDDLASSAPPPVEELAPSASPTDESSSGSVADSSPSGEDTPRQFLPVQKIKDSAFSRGGANLNRVYIARPGDTVKGVSQKIFGSNRRKDLLAWNPHLQRGLKTGDKVYYPSPAQPDDTRMMTYYEDSGIPPATHVTAEGDNIRKLSKELLGSSESWKEVWATNMAVESKGDLPPGTELRYWPEGAAASAPTLAQNQSPPPVESVPSAPPEDIPPPPAADPSQPTQDLSSMTPPPAEENIAMNEPPPGDPPPPVDAAGTTEAPPPPPLDEPSDPSPPPPNPVAKKAPLDAAEEVTDGDTTMMMGFGVILIAASVALLFFIRKNRAKRIDLGQTQV